MWLTTKFTLKQAKEFIEYAAAKLGFKQHTFTHAIDTQSYCDCYFFSLFHITIYRQRMQRKKNESLFISRHCGAKYAKYFFFSNWFSCRSLYISMVHFHIDPFFEIREYSLSFHFFFFPFCVRVLLPAVVRLYIMNIHPDPYHKIAQRITAAL